MKYDFHEWEMRPAAAAFLRLRGMLPICEVVTGHLTDYIGVKWSERIGRKRPSLEWCEAVELKLTDIKGVLLQCEHNLKVSNRSWAMMPFETVSAMKEKTLSRFREKGIGLVSFFEGVSRVEIEAGDIGCGWKRSTDNLWKRSRQPDSRHDIGGVMMACRCVRARIKGDCDECHGRRMIPSRISRFSMEYAQ